LKYVGLEQLVLSPPFHWILIIELIIVKLRFKWIKCRIALNVATLALGLRPKQGLARVQDKTGAREAHLILPGVQESVREWTLTFPSELPLWELDFWWTFESLGSNCKGQNPLEWKVLYIIGNILKLRCLKWARMTHLDI